MLFAIEYSIRSHVVICDVDPVDIEVINFLKSFDNLQSSMDRGGATRSANKLPSAVSESVHSSASSHIQKAMPHTSKSSLYTLCEVSLDRLSVSIAEKSSVTGKYNITGLHTSAHSSITPSDKLAEDHQFNTLLHVVIYGIYTQLETIGQDEYEVVLRVGCMKIYGNNFYSSSQFAGDENIVSSPATVGSGGSEQMQGANHIELFSCGRPLTDSYDGSNSLKDAAIGDLALSLSIQSCHTVADGDILEVRRRQSIHTVKKVRSAKTHDSKSRTARNQTTNRHVSIRRQHFVVELSLDVCYAYWDQPTMLFLRNIILSLMLSAKSSTNVISTKTVLEAKKMISHVLRYRNAELNQVRYSSKKDASAAFSDSADSLDMYDDPTPKFSLDIILKGFIINIPSESSVPHADDFAKMYAKPRQMASATHGALASEEGKSALTEVSQSSVDSDYSDDSETNLIDSDDDDDEYNHMPFTPLTSGPDRQTLRYDTPSFATKNTHFFPEPPVDARRPKLSKQNLAKLEENQEKPQAELHILPPCLFPRRRKKVHSTLNLPVLQFKVSLINFSSGDFLEGYVANVKHLQHIENCKREEAESKAKEREEDAFTSPVKDRGVSKSQKHKEEANSSKEDDNVTMWPRADNILCHAIEKIKSPVIRSIAFGLKNVELKFVKRIAAHDAVLTLTSDESFELIRNLTKIPWCVKGVISQSELPYHPLYTDWKLHILFSPLAAALSTQDMISMIDASHCIEDVIKIPKNIEAMIYKKKLYNIDEHQYTEEEANNRVQSTALPRFSELSGLSKLYVNAHFDDICLSLMEEKDDAPESSCNLVESIVKRYVDQMLSRGLNQTRVIKACKRLSSQRLCNIGIPRAQAEVIMDTLHNSIAHSLNRPDDDDSVEEEAMVYASKAISQVLQLLVMPSPTVLDTDESPIRSSDAAKINELLLDRRTPISSLEMKGLGLTVEQLMYDHRALVFMKELRLSDQNRNPILLVAAKNRAPVHPTARTNQTPVMDRSSRLGSLNSRNTPRSHKAATTTSAGAEVRHLDDIWRSFSEHNAMCSAIVVTVQDRDNDFEYGTGGYDSESVFSTGSPLKSNNPGGSCYIYPSHLANRKRDTDVKVSHVDSYLSRDGIPRIIEQVLPAIGRVQHHYDVVGFAYKRHQQLLVNNVFIPQLGYRNIFDTNSMYYIDIAAIAVQSQKLKRMFDSPTVVKSSPEEERSRNNRPVAPVKTANVAQRRFSMDIARRMSAPDVRNSVVIPKRKQRNGVSCFSCSVQIVVVLLAHEDKIMAELILNSVNVENRPGLEPPPTNSETCPVKPSIGDDAVLNSEDHTVVTVDHLRMYDLTAAGSMHSQFIWSLPKPGVHVADTNTSTAATTESIFEGDGGKHPHCLVVHLSNKEYSLGYFKKTVNISTNVDESQTDSQTPGPMQTENIHAGNSPVLHGNSLVNVTREIVDLNINTYGVNACFLFRFYQELMLFVFGKIITPIDAALKANASGREDIANKILDCTVLGLDDFDAFVDESRVYGAQNMATHDPMEADVDDESLHSSDDSLYDDFGDIDYLSSSSESDMEESLDGKSPNMGLYNSPVGLTTSNSPSMFETPLVDGSRNESNDFFTPFGKPVNSMGRSGSKYALNSAVSARRSGLRRRSSYRYSAHENLSPVISLESRAENVRDSQLFINIHLHDFAGILPRNSCSEDLVGLTAQYAYVSFYPVEESWKGIFERREVNISDHDSTVHDTIHFDVRKNDWAAGCTDATTTKIPCFNMPDIRNTDGEFADSPVGEPSVDVFDNKPPVVKPTLSKLFSLVSSTENEISKETLVSEATQDSVSVAHDAENVYDVRHSDADPWVMGRRTTMTSSDFASTLHASTVQSQPPDYSGYAEYVPIKAKGDEPYMRHYIRLESVSILGCLHSPIDCSLGLVQQQSIDESRKFSRIRPNHAIYTGLNSHGDKRSRHSHRAKARASVHHEENPSISAAHSYTSRMQWHPITSESFDLKIIIDVNPRNVLQVRTLISDTENFTPICLKATMGELYLLKSIYFDNICELPQFFDSPHDNPPNIGGGPTDETDAIPESIPEYGTPEYLMYLKDRPLFKHSGFAMVCAKLTLDTSIDINYFSENVPSLPYLLRNATPGSELLEWLMSAFHAADSSERQSLWNYQSVPIATIGVERWVLHVQNDLEVTQVGLGADGVYIVDIRTPAQTCQPTLVQASAVETADDNENGVRTENYGFVDFDYGLFLQPSSLKEYIKPTQVGTPLQLTVHVSAKSNWTTTNVGVDNADINIINLDMIWLLADIFSLYFVSPDYGNPSVAAYKALPSDLLPYGGSDTRVFATRPHIIVMASPLNATSQSLHLETDCGIYYRNSIDFHGSVNVEVNFSDLALVLLRHYKPAYIARGMRGAAGSGRGVRTQIDHLSGSVVHHYDAIMNHFDLQVNIEPIDIFDRHQDQTEKTLVDFDDERLKLHPSTLFQPKCVFPLSGIDRDFPENSCDVVTSYEDMLLTVSLITTLIDMKKPEIPPLSDGDSHAGGDPSALAGAVAEVPPEGIFHLASMFTVIRIQSLKCLIVDNVLGLHLPLLQLFVDYLQYDSDKRLVTSSVFDAQQSKRSGDYSHRRSTSDGNDSNPTSYSENDRRASKVVLKHRRMSSLSRTPSERKLLDDLLNENSEDSSKKTPQFTSVTHIRGRLWADYFSNVLKCWECLFEPVMPVALLEEVCSRHFVFAFFFGHAFVQCCFVVA